MYREELFEEGIVTECSNGFAVIDILNKEKCEECTAKVYCKPSGETGRQLKVKDNFGVECGDRVRVCIEGKKIMTASLFIYGIPLILLLIGIYFGFMFFETNKELFSFLLGISLISFYSGVIFLVHKYRGNLADNYPQIIFVSKGALYEHNIIND